MNFTQSFKLAIKSLLLSKMRALLTMLGIIIGVVAVVLASLTLITDFQAIEAGVQNRIPERYSWTMSFSLMVSLIWLYVEILRLLSYFRQD